MKSLTAHNEMCDRFTQQWDDTRACLDRISSFVSASLPGAANHPCQLVHELTKRDLELAWRRWSQMLELSSLGLNHATLFELFRQLPNAAVYDPLRCAACLNRVNLLDLVGCEAAARATWGDALGPAYFRQMYQVDIDPPRIKPRTITAKFAPLLETQRPDLTIPLRGVIDVGRCSRPEQSIGATETASGAKLLIANLHERAISRSQLRIQLLSPNRALIINQATSSPESSTQIDQLPAGQFRVVGFPFMVKLPGVKLVAN